MLSKDLSARHSGYSDRIDENTASEKGEAIERVGEELKLRTKIRFPNTARRNIWARVGALGSAQSLQTTSYAGRGRPASMENDA